MKLARYGLLIAALSTSASALAKEPEIVISSKDQVSYSVTVDDIDVQAANKKFTFDWNKYQTAKPNQLTLKQAEQMIAKIKPDTQLNKQDIQSLGKLFFKLGAYYTNISHDPDLAITKLNQARTLVTTTDEKAAVYNQLAYAYQQKYAQNKQSEDKEKALNFTKKVIDLYPRQNLQTAYATYINALIEYDAQNYSQAETTLKEALDMYESLPNGKDNEQYVRAKNQFASIILNKPGHEQDAIAQLQELKQYWEGKHDYYTNPYAAQSFMTLGEAYLKAGKIEEARTEINLAIDIYTKVYGKNSKQLVTPYQLLAEIYRKTGDEKQSSDYLKKSQALSSV